jgi:hypothetical protein
LTRHLYSDIPEIGHPFWPSFGLTDLTNGFIQLLAERGAKWHNGASYESDKENAKDIAHRIPKYFRM